MAARECRVVLIKSEMDDETQVVAIETANEAMSKFGTEREIAEFIKKYFDDKFGIVWQCVVGRDFGNCVNSISRHYIFFKIDHLKVLLYKSSG